INPVIIEREYIPVYISFYSPGLNLIGQFQKALKNRVRKSELTDVEGSEDVPAEYLQFHLAFHKVFSKHYNKEPL
ncbi:hypothetical protein K501DRAFT_173553, partial [Backusella circina FSU 941]